jgi:uncharacterized protein (UPF0548 family)
MIALLSTNRQSGLSGEIAWQRAVEAVRGWQMFNMPRLRLCWPTAPLPVGTEVAVLVHHFGFFSLNACRIVYLVDDNAGTKRFGFAYGTLNEHGRVAQPLNAEGITIVGAPLFAYFAKGGYHGC